MRCVARVTYLVKLNHGDKTWATTRWTRSTTRSKWYEDAELDVRSAGLE